MKISAPALLLAAPALFLGVSTPQAAHAAPADVVAREGTVQVTAADVADMLNRLDPATRAKIAATPGALTEIVRGRLATEALLAEAQSKGWAQRPEIARQLAFARDNVIAQTYITSVSVPDASYPSDADVSSAYEANKAQFLVPRTDHLSQIIVQGGTDDKSRRQAIAAGRNFAGSNPVDIGTVTENRLQPDIKAAVEGLQPGGISAPVHLMDGWHVFKLVGTTPAGTAPLSAVRPQIVDALRRQKAEQNAHAYLTALQGKQHAEINEIALSQAVPK